MKHQHKNISRRLAAAMMAGAMMVSMVGMTAFATGGQPEIPKNVTITKEISKESNVYAPSTSFEFKIEPGTPVSGSNDQDAIQAGPTDGAYFDEEDKYISSVPNTDGQNGDIGKTTITAGQTSITIDETKFTEPGIYRYNVSEVSSTYEGVEYTKEVKYFDVYVNKDGEVYSYAFVSAEDDKVKDDGVFENEYGVGGAEGELNDLTIKKTVTGNQGNLTKEFNFTIKIVGTEGEKYYMLVNNNDGQTETYTLSTGIEQDFTLANNETAVIYGLSKSDTYTVTEDDYTSEGYTTKIDDGTPGVLSKTGTLSADTTVTVNNDNTVSTPTGVAMTIAPYAIMVVAAAGVAFLFLRRRHSEF